VSFSASSPECQPLTGPRNNIDLAGDAQETPFPRSGVVTPGGGDDAHVVGPVHSPEAHLIANYLRNEPGSSVPPGISQIGRRPILFNAVRKHPLGYAGSQSVALQKCDIIENLVAPFRNELIDVCVMVIAFFSADRC
jgi:hypothetical protein